MCEAELPYKVDYAKSARASCKSCKKPIMKDALRIATVVQSSHFDGKMVKWFHYKCFFQSIKIRGVEEIDGFSNIKYDDQKSIEELVGTANGVPQSRAAEANLFSVEKARSGQAKCRTCGILIGKDQLRISKTQFEIGRSKGFGGTPGWHHLDCFISKRESLGWYSPADSLPGFDVLGAQERKILSDRLPGIELPSKRPTTSTLDDDEESPKKRSKAEETALKKQSDSLFKLRKELDDNLSKKQLMAIFETNGIKIPAGISAMQECLADALTFGVCEPCPECREKALLFSNNEYRCSGNFSEFTTCNYVTTEPKRTKIEIPSELLDKYSFLKGKVGKRKLAAPLKTAASQETGAAEGEAIEEVKKSLLKVLSGCHVIIESTDSDVQNVRAKLLTYGARIVKAVGSYVLCVISTEANVKKRTVKVKQAERHNVFVVSEKFLDDCAEGTVDLKAHALTEWGDEAAAKKYLDAAMDCAKTVAASSSTTKSRSSLSSQSRFLKSSTQAASDSKKAMLSLMNGATAVDPACGMASWASVYRDGDDIYNCVLSRADVSQGINSFYKMQLLTHSNDYYVFRSWGRIGTTVGNTKLEHFAAQDSARKNFEAVFLEKTGNKWENRKQFEKKPKYFDMVEMDMTPSELHKPDTKQLLKANSKSKLPMAVQEFICMIFDVDVMEQQLKDFDIDLKKMPLGKISRDQITKAYKILNELQDAIEKKAPRIQLLDASNRFFTVIPHDFGMDSPPVIETLELLKEKIDMLESLREMELTMKMIKEGVSTTELPVDHHYTQLNTEMDVLPRDSKTFGVLQKYLNTTHGTTHSGYSLEISDIFTMARHGEAERFKKFETLHNRKLLWHGSRLTNFVGIISQGLRIAPPEAPVSGYMFGKGIYFADMVSKSANYCCTSPSNPVGLLLLCDVALGDMYELKNSEFVRKLPNGKHSTKGLGSMEPAKNEHLDDVVVPMGPGKKRKDHTCLLYNEYIIYDVAQAQIKYLLKVNFKYNY